ncbi:MAG: hypothetical protein A2583_02880 [Bdellovibrionales bacterium RIFOXYD1_FULL_53_11]|nr:MAG: hypothetical protein A2583_02880 [Bdellovibrionales bacterium RIFOXYD1_FULL_53_11]
MENNIFGREEEKIILQKLMASQKPEFLAVYGRRRVGKTFLINEFFENRGLYFEIIGARDEPAGIQLARFSAELSRIFFNKEPATVPDNWDKAFQSLRDEIEKFREREPSRKIILFFDEIPWLDSRKSGFLSSLDYFWNKYLSKNSSSNMILIICGSAASWMLEKIINNKGGLHNRLTQTIKISPFSLEETGKYLQSRQVFLEKKQITDLYMCTGGVPKYLSYIEKGLSPAQIIDNLCFKKGGYLSNEFENLYSALFKNHAKHLAIIRTLAKTMKGLEKHQLLTAAKLSDGGSSTLVLKELESSDFITGTPFYKKEKKSKFYRLVDEFSLFYLKWMESAGTRDILTGHWQKMMDKPAWKTWSGYAFEGICFKHIQKIKAALGIAGVLTTESSWHGKGIQVDLVLDRADQIIHLFEIKYYSNPWNIKKQEAEKLNQRKAVFKEITGTRKTVFTTLLTTLGAENNPQYFACVDQQLRLENLF